MPAVGRVRARPPALPTPESSRWETRTRGELMTTYLRGRRARRDSLAAAAFLAPDLVGLLVFVFLPIAFAIYVSFFSWNLISPMQFVGIANYQRLLSDSEWWLSLGRTLQFAVIYVPIL